MIGDNTACVGLDRDLRTFLNVVHMTAFVDRGARRLRRTRQPERQSQGVQVRGVMIQYTAGIQRRSADPAQRILIQNLDLVIAVCAPHVARVVVQVFDVRGLGARPRHTGFDLAIDLVFRDQGFDQCLGLFPQIPKLFRVIGAQHLFQRELVHTLA